MFRNFEILVVMRKDPTIRECFENNVFDKTELVEALGSPEFDKILDLSMSHEYDSNEEDVVLKNPDVQKLVEEAFKKFDKKFQHFSVLGLPPNLSENSDDIDNSEHQVITIVEIDGTLKTVKIPKSVKLTEEEQVPPALQNFYMVNLRKVKESLANLPNDHTNLQDSLIHKILHEMAGPSTSKDLPPSAKRRRTDSPSRSRSPKRNFEKTPNKSKKSYKKQSANKKKNFEQKSQKSTFTPPPASTPTPPPLNVPFQSQAMNPFHQQWQNPNQNPPVNPNNLGAAVGWVNLPNVGMIHLPRYEGHGNLEQGQIELNKATIAQIYAQFHSAQMYQNRQSGFQ